MNFIIEHETTLRLGFFAGILVVMASWEMAAPRRKLTVPKASRWLSNLTLVALNTVVLRAIAPLAAVGMALLADEQGWGILNIISMPYVLAVILAVILLDLAIYLQHVMFHAVPVFWRLHMVHHADLDFDVTTGARFHPIEIILSMGIKMTVVAIIGPPAVGVIIFEILLSATSLFNHGNVRLPVTVDRVLRLLVVTPEMHRVHHSVIPRETNSNFGFNLPWWDRLFGTYCDQPAAGHLGMTIGLTHCRDKKAMQLHWMLALPFVGQVGNYPINRRTDSKSEAR